MNVDRLYEALSARLRGRVDRDILLAPYTTYRLGGRAALMVEADGDGDLEVLGAVLRAEQGEVPVLPLGRGSNLVVSDGGFPGVVVRLGKAFGGVTGWDPEGAPASGVVSGGATSLPQLANFAARRGLAGLEWAVGVPGSVGGGVRMNAGAHGKEIAQALASVNVWRIDRSSFDSLSVSDLGYEYRRSDLTERDIVTRAWFHLTPDAPEAIKARTDDYRRHRALTQPGALQNAGSVFKNPPGDHAGRLVDEAGLKGFAVGGASVSDLHANFFIASEGATAQDVFDLVAEIRVRVKERFGVELEPEIRFVGAFVERSLAGGGR